MDLKIKMTMIILDQKGYFQGNILLNGFLKMT